MTGSTLLWGVLLLAPADAGVSDSGATKVPDASASAPRPVDLRWSRQSAPFSGPAQVLGAPGSGCVQGAARFPERGSNWVLVHPERHREFGHPDLLRYLRHLAGQARKQGLGKLHVGDLGQPGGGPTPSGHRSHQNGLDVDLWFTEPGKPLQAGAAPPAPVVVDLKTRQMTKLWSNKVASLIQAAASDPSVDRIFVHPSVKRALCKAGPRGAWLRLVRPWYGHHDHLHVRLRCPADSVECVAGQPLPPGEGCDASLDWWFGEDARATAEKRAKEGPAAPPLPLRCEELLTGIAAPTGGKP